MEQWKNIDNYDYEVSTKGRVRNLRTGRIMKGIPTRGGYLQIGLFKNGERKRFYIHRLVLETFNPTDDETLEVNHINENVQNNRLENLEWTTHKKNMNHGTRTERSSKNRGKRIKCIETEQIFDSINECSRITGIQVGNLWKQLNGKIKSCKGLHFEYVK